MSGPFVEEISQIIAYIIELCELKVYDEHILVLLNKHISKMHIVMTQNSFCICQYFRQIIYNFFISKRLIKVFLAFIN